jgi:hypothetical protein
VWPLQAAFNQAAVSKALHIIGMFMPKLGFTPFFVVGVLAAGLAGAAGAAAAVPVAAVGAAPVALPLVVAVVLPGAVSAARSHDPFSWERATEKNKNT